MMTSANRSHNLQQAAKPTTHSEPAKVPFDFAALYTRSFRQSGCHPRMVAVLTSDHSFGMILCSLLSPLSTEHLTTDRDSAAGLLRASRS